MLEVLYESKNAIIANKPVGMPTQADKSADPDFLSELKSEHGELYLVHRLDRVVSGLLVLARNKSTCAELSALAASGALGKEYLAVVEGECSGGELVDYLYKNAALSKSFVTDKGRFGAKLASLTYECIETADTPRGVRSLVRINLKTGRFHQIRAQFSTRGHALVGDGKYGSRDSGARTPALFAYKIDVTAGEHISAAALPDINQYPWNLFSEESYKKCLN